MTVNKRSKSSRHRGSKTHGWGDKKKHRGSGHRGGTGNAGSGKKADCKKPKFWKDPFYFGKFGFKRQNTLSVNDINLQYLESKAKTLVAENLVVEKDGKLIVDLNKLGFDKLLSKGIVTKKWEITVKHASETAKSKVQEAGGNVITE